MDFRSQKKGSGSTILKKRKKKRKIPSDSIYNGLYSNREWRIVASDDKLWEAVVKRMEFITGISRKKKTYFHLFRQIKAEKKYKIVGAIYLSSVFVPLLPSHTFLDVRKCPPPKEN